MAGKLRRTVGRLTELEFVMHDISQRCLAATPITELCDQDSDTVLVYNNVGEIDDTWYLLQPLQRGNLREKEWQVRRDFVKKLQLVIAPAQLVLHIGPLTDIRL